jgi:predicted transposase YdaD
MALSITYEQIEAELLARGREEGREAGELKRSQEIALALLWEGMAPEMAARLTQLTIVQLPQLAD